MIYLDNAATSMIKPKCVIDAVINAMTSLGNAGRGVNDASLDAARVIFNVRKKIANFFNAKSPSCVAFTLNVTESLNIAIRGLLCPGDHVITTVMEHNSVLRPLYYLKNEIGLDVDYIKTDPLGCIDIEDIKRAVKKNTRAIIMTHASNLTGNVNDVESVGKIAKEKGVLFIVDAAQTAGVFPIDVEKMNIDVLCFTGHKGLLGPQGTGGLAVKEGVDISPLKSGGSGVQTYLKTHPKEMPTRLEAGTLNGHGLAGLSAAVDYIDATGIENIRNKEQSLMKLFYEEISKNDKVIVYGDFKDYNRAPIVNINIKDLSSDYVGDRLYNDFGICIRSGAHCAPMMHKALGTEGIGSVRFSFSHFNTKEEVIKSLEAIEKIIAEDIIKASF